MELPRIQGVYEELKPNYDDLQIVIVEINNQRALAEQFIAENNLTFINAEADRGFVKEKFNTGGYPNSFIIDRERIIRDHKLGFRPGDEVDVKDKLVSLLDK